MSRGPFKPVQDYGHTLQKNRSPQAEKGGGAGSLLLPSIEFRLWTISSSVGIFVAERGAGHLPQASFNEHDN